MKHEMLLERLEEVQKKSGVSGMALAIARGKQPATTFVTGQDAQGSKLTENSLFPVASITKLATALAILRLCDQGLLAISDLLANYLPEAKATQSNVTLQHLLTHTSGLADLDEGLWAGYESLSWTAMKPSILRVAPEWDPGTRVCYRSGNYALLGMVIERVTSLPLSQAMPELVYQPLGIEAYQGVEPPRLPAFINDPGDEHAATPFALWNTAFWRSWGEPWAGMVTTPAGTLGLLRAYLGYPEGFLRPEILKAAIQDQTGGVGGGFPWQEFPSCPWGLGPMIFTEGLSHWLYPNAIAGTIGYGGYTGCAVFAIPEREISWAVFGTESCAGPWWQEPFASISAAILQDDLNSR